MKNRIKNSLDTRLKILHGVIGRIDKSPLFSMVTCYDRTVLAREALALYAVLSWPNVMKI